MNSDPGPSLPAVSALVDFGRRPLVAVLPFGPEGIHPALRLLGIEIADALRERLAQDPALQAILISSDFLAKAPPHAVELVCRELGVGHIISGKCHGTAECASLYVEVTDTRAWQIRWAHFFRGNARRLLVADSEELAALAHGLRDALVKRRRR